ncbi:S41 family peptidase [Dethiobacter alkaliphilus]|nr:S41 family peptidase [Dethiobacter alkaliphilus]
MKRRIIIMLAVALVLSNLITYRATRNAYRWPVNMPPAAEENGDDNVAEEKSAELAAFLEVLSILEDRYLDEVSQEELLTAAIQGMVESLDDPQTSFLDPSHWEEMMITIDGSFSGIGVEINSVDDYITIISPIRNTPGERAGLLAGDRIVEVDGEDIVGITTMEAVQLMRGPEGTPVTITVERDGVDEPITVEIIRESIMLPSVFPKMLESGIGYIEVTNFDEHTGETFREALLELETEDMGGLILDLRDNPGGLLNEAVKIARELLPAGPITHMVDRDGEILETYQSFGTEKPYPIVVLVNGASASASEIIAGAFQDTGTATVVGTKTYGKATVQHLEGLANSTGLRYTVAKYQTPNGRDINEVGLEPDVEVELPDELRVLFHRVARDLKPGDEDMNVQFLQQMLKSLDYNVNDTGVYDSATERAVRSFQNEHGLNATGELNLETRTQLNEEIDRLLEENDTQMQKAVEVILEKM